MKRKDRERTDRAFMDQVLLNADILWISLNRDGAPYVIPVNPAFCDGVLYFHCATEGLKLDLLRKDPRIGFATAVGVEIIPEKSTTHYHSISGSGRASLVSSDDEKQKALKSIRDKYQAKCTIPASESRLKQLQIVRIDIEEMTGKEAK